MSKLITILTLSLIIVGVIGLLVGLSWLAFSIGGPQGLILVGIVALVVGWIIFESDES